MIRSIRFSSCTGILLLIMSYPFDKYEFDDITEYIAAKRDKARIDSLEKKGRSKAQIARNMKEQIARESISFETVVGEDFLKQLDKDSFTHVEETDFERQERKKKRKNAHIKQEKKARHLLLIPFYLILTLAAGIGILWIAKEEQSRKSMEELQQRASAFVTPTAVPTKPAAELSAVNEPVPEEHTDKEEPAPEVIPTEILPRFKELHEENNDLAGWLTIEGTVIDYPVMYKEDDNDFYLSHNFEGKNDVSGLLVLDKRCRMDGSGMNMLIHGHHMRNGSMFGSLQKYEDESYYREHPVINFSTLYQERRYEIFAVFISSVYDDESDDIKFYDFIDIRTREEFNSYIRSALDDSLYDTGVRPYWGDKLISLSTCEYSKENGRLVIVGREIK